MGIDRRQFLRGFATTAVGLPASEALGCASPEAIMICRQGTRYAGLQRIPRVFAQQTMVWCWAATLEMIFAAHGKRISQRKIVEQVYGRAVEAPIDRLSLLQSIDRTYTDNQGNDFDVTSGIFDLATGQATISNVDIVDEFQAGRPIIYCNQTHMVAAYGAYFSPSGTAYSPVTICRVMVADPWPPDVGNYRQLELCEMVPAFFPGGQLTFVATVQVS